MNTVLRELKIKIDLLSSIVPNNGEHNNAVIETYKHCSKMIEDKISDEKRQLKDAFIAGSWDTSGTEDENEMSNNYYQETFADNNG